MRAFWLSSLAVAVSAIAIVVLTARAGGPEPAGHALSDFSAIPADLAYVDTSLAPTVPAVAEQLRVLFIGNSYTLGNDLPGTVSILAEANGLGLDVGVEAIYGFSLATHVERSDVIEELRNGDWDVVVIQELSIAPADPDLFAHQTIPAVAELVALARAAGTEVLFFETWAHRSGNADIGQPGYGPMQRAVVESYEHLAEVHGARVATVGQNWARTMVEYPELSLYVADGSHPSAIGSYLAALTLARALKQSPLHAAEPIGVTPSVAELLRNLVNADAPS